MLERGAPVRLSFDASVSPIVRARIGYAFRTFCAVYRRDCAIVESSDTTRDGVIRYGTDVPAFYAARATDLPAPVPARIGDVPVFHHDGQRVDWLGEIFEWLSCAHEYSVTERDSVGRVPFAQTLHGRYGLDPTIPFASVAMKRFADAIGIPAPSTRTRIAASHDLDYLPTSTTGNLRRLLKNVAIALVDKDLGLALGIAGSGVAGLFRRRSPLDGLALMRERERALGIVSTSNVIVRNACARDANYSIDDRAIVRELHALHDAGGEIGLHSSYMSLRDGGFGDEVRALQSLGFGSSGVRAHWLRYAGSDLFDAVADAGLAYDTSVGFPDRVGFRSGASFVYRPYDFSNEAAYPLYEVPLAIMDGALYVHARTTRSDPATLAHRVLDMVDAYPSGGASVLWHNTVFEGAQLPAKIGALYWKLRRPNQEWKTNAQVVDDEAPWFDRAFAQGETIVC